MQYRQLRLNGEQYTATELLELVSKQLSRPDLHSWERHLFTFLLNWLDEGKGFIITYTSGSTGKPKAIELDKQKMLISAHKTNAFLGLNAATNALLALSCEHIAGKMMVVRALEGGYNLVTTPPSSHPLDNLHTASIHFTALVPYQVKAIVESGAEGISKLQLIDNIIIGGAPVNTALEKVLAQFPGAVYETFGMTETVSHIALRRLSGTPDTHFQAVGNTKVSLNEDGCLCIHAPDILDEPLATHDLAEIDSPTRFRWLGRKDYVVNSGGVKLFPEQIEKQIRPLLEDPFFIGGLPHPKLGEQLVLVVERSTPLPEEATLIEQLRSILSAYEVPKQVHSLSQFVYTASGKLNRKATLELMT